MSYHIAHMFHMTYDYHINKKVQYKLICPSISHHISELLTNPTSFLLQLPVSSPSFQCLVPGFQFNFYLQLDSFSTLFFLFPFLMQIHLHFQVLPFNLQFVFEAFLSFCNGVNFICYRDFIAMYSIALSVVRSLATFFFLIYNLSTQHLESKTAIFSLNK